MLERIRALPIDDQLSLLSDFITSYAESNYGLTVPSDFLKLALQGMKNLQDAGRVNVIYSLLL